MDQENEYLPMKTSPSEQSLQPRDDAQWRMSIGAVLSRLALHFWRPDFTAAQAKLLFVDFFSDLKKYTPQEIDDACAIWRRDPANKFFPTTGQLLGILKPEVKSEPRSRHSGFKGWPELNAPRATKSVAEILRENGFELAAKSWPQ